MVNKEEKLQLGTVTNSSRVTALKKKKQKNKTKTNKPKNPQIYWTIFWWGLEYNECTPCREVRPPAKWYFLNMRLNCMWWLIFNSGDPGSVEYRFIAIIPRPTLTGVVVSVWKLTLSLRNI